MVTIPPLYLQDEWVETGETRDYTDPRTGDKEVVPVVKLKRRASIAWEGPSWDRRRVMGVEEG